jgi:hypothetical protein
VLLAFAKEFTSGGWWQHYPFVRDNTKSRKEANAENEPAEIPTGERSYEN